LGWLLHTSAPAMQCSSPCAAIAANRIPQESPAANKIKEAFFSEKGLAGNVQKLPLEKVFEIESVKKVGRRRGRGRGVSSILPGPGPKARLGAAGLRGGRGCGRGGAAVPAA
jgi:hypothetical protein